MHQVFGSIRKKRARDSKFPTHTSNEALTDRLDIQSISVVRDQTENDETSLEEHHMRLKRSKSLPAASVDCNLDKVSIVNKFNKLYSRQKHKTTSNISDTDNNTQSTNMSLKSSNNTQQQEKQHSNECDIDCDNASENDAMDPNAYSALSALLEIRRDTTMNSTNSKQRKHTGSLLQQIGQKIMPEKNNKRPSINNNNNKSRKRRISSDLNGGLSSYP
eukprot:452787_1